MIRVFNIAVCFLFILLASFKSLNGRYITENIIMEILHGQGLPRASLEHYVYINRTLSDCV